MAEKSMEDVIAKIRECADSLTSLADSLEMKTGANTEKPEAEITFTDLRGRLAEKSRAGHTAQIRDLLKKHGAEKLSEVDKSEYAALLAEVETLS